MENVVDYYRRKLIRHHQTRTNLAELLFVLYVAFLPPNVYSASKKFCYIWVLSLTDFIGAE